MGSDPSRRRLAEAEPGPLQDCVEESMIKKFNPILPQIRLNPQRGAIVNPKSSREVRVLEDLDPIFA